MTLMKTVRCCKCDALQNRSGVLTTDTFGLRGLTRWSGGGSESEDRALEPMFARLAELNIPPELELGEAKTSAKSELVERVIRRAQEMQASWHSNQETADNSFFK